MEKDKTKVVKVDLYQIMNIETGEMGKPFGLCQDCFEKWEAKNYVVWFKIGENTSYPCNSCSQIEEIWKITEKLPSLTDLIIEERKNE